MSRSFTLAVERVADDRRFATRFRRDPRRALRPYRLSGDQVEAVKSGEPAALAHHGLDLEKFQRGDRHGLRPYWRKAIVAMTVVGATVGLARGPVAASPRCDLKDCPGKPILAGLIRASGRATIGRDQIRLGRFLVTRTSLRAALQRAGARADGARALGRRALRRRLDTFCTDGCVGDINAVGPILLADADG